LTLKVKSSTAGTFFITLEHVVTIILKALIRPFESELTRVKNLIRDQIKTDHPFRKQMNHYLLSMNGKQLRALLLLLCSCKKGAKFSEDSRKVAAILEMVHNATLIHDDIIDRAEMRRGKMTLGKKWGETTAILFGDILVAKAFHLCSTIGSLEILGKLANGVSEVCNGEILQNHYAFRFDITEKIYLDIVKKKTASLFHLACDLGATLGNFDRAASKHMKQFGEFLGIAYQMVDDCMDWIVPTKNSGKSNFRDLSEGKVTLPLLFLRERCSKKDWAGLQSSLFHLEGEKKKLFWKCVQETDCVESTFQEAQHYLEKAKRSLFAIPDLKYRDTLEQFLNVLKRPLLSR
jgi:octaprenyl-diphosphate synthase